MGVLVTKYFDGCMILTYQEQKTCLRGFASKKEKNGRRYIIKSGLDNYRWNPLFKSWGWYRFGKKENLGQFFHEAIQFKLVVVHFKQFKYTRYISTHQAQYSNNKNFFSNHQTCNGRSLWIRQILSSRKSTNGLQ